MPLVHALYVSAISPGVSLDVVQGIARAAEISNRKIDVTGMLLYSAGHFMQVLEGEPTVVGELLQRIERDIRHTDMQIIYRGSILRRVFGSWNMGLLNAFDLKELDRQKLNDVIDRAYFTHQTDKANGKVAIKLLRHFRHQLPAPIDQPAPASLR